MAYGLQVFGGNNVLQIDSNTNLTGFSGAAITTSSSIEVSPGDLVFCKHSPSYGDIRYFGVDTSTSTWTAYSRLNSPYLSGNSAWQPFNLDWLILRAASTAPTPPPGTYGLQVKNAANQIAFDSRSISFGFNITGYLASLTASGNPYQDSGPAAPLGEWVSIEHGFMGSYTNDFTNPISLAGLAFANNNTIGSITVNGAYYFGRFTLFNESYWPNFSDIVIGENY